MLKTCFIAIVTMICVASLSAKDSKARNAKKVYYLDSSFNFVPDKSQAHSYFNVSYINGKIKNPCVGYYLSGKKYWEGNIIQLDDASHTFVMDGKFTYYYSNGKKNYALEYKSNTLNGSYQAWWPNGKIKEKCTYVNGNLYGCDFQWDENGNCLVAALKYTDEEYLNDPEKFNITCDCKTGTSVKNSKSNGEKTVKNNSIKNLLKQNKDAGNVAVYECNNLVTEKPIYILITANFKGEEFKSLYESLTDALSLRMHLLSDEELKERYNDSIKYKFEFYAPEITSKYDNGEDLASKLMERISGDIQTKGYVGTVKVNVRIIKTSNNKALFNEAIRKNTNLSTEEIDKNAIAPIIKDKINQIVHALVKVSPKINSIVKETSKGIKKVEINCGNDLGLWSGYQFKIRDANKDIVGHMKIVEVRNHSSICKIEDGGDEIGELVRKKEYTIVSDYSLKDEKFLKSILKPNK